MGMIHLIYVLGSVRETMVFMTLIVEYLKAVKMVNIKRFKILKVYSG